VPVGDDRTFEREDGWMRGATDALEQVLAATKRRRGEGLGLTRIAVDGRDAAGKSTFADHLATGLAESGIETYRASIDTGSSRRGFVTAEVASVLRGTTSMASTSRV
jgi:adenylylsulfate kinase-like enzyme